MSADQSAASDAERTSLAWSRTLIGFAAVVGLIGVRAALVDASLYAIIPVLTISVTLLLVNGIVSARTLARAKVDMAAGARAIRVKPALVTASAATILALASLGVLFMGAPPR